ncbi:hypothetical protein VOLCADRAFT_87956 [Volvox carteri f. nagariensis]|uniref:Mce/MlaD domain-containing protein n=1 Tax=Volvox carteri f. nagariensis TaxID=3068 RepID=D8TMP4_VOLCA|nr:uncharacterized protein VOLCADRAFT_87956 [Volvox carteri f. nagariensis]EFJ51162.1 hypothetical protein VOLCADRAFT_87956 [Volvox carteri f. nagariensis]|eukprot:XP_002947629.1 hypothetical protein VOLCADRAFT_87956 [Volvox carteri f. nagariensis]
MHGTEHFVSPAPALHGGSRLGAGATPGPVGSSVGAAETNGAPMDTSFEPSGARKNTPESGAGASSSSTNTNGGPASPVPMGSSTRASFRSVIKRTYLGELLFVVIGSAICGALAYWTVGTPLRRFNPYSFYIMLPQATGVQLGTPLRMKGVPMGSVLSATPMLDRVKVEVEVNEAKTIIPRNAKFELTQSGLIPSPSIDITTPEGVSAEFLAAAVASARNAKGRTGKAAAAAGEAAAGDGAAATAAAAAAAAGASPVRSGRSAKVRLANPKDIAACHLQGVLVCQGDVVDGLQGGSMDELMAHMLKSLRQGEGESTGIVPGRGPLQG